MYFSAKPFLSIAKRMTRIPVSEFGAALSSGEVFRELLESAPDAIVGIAGHARFLAEPSTPPPFKQQPPRKAEVQRLAMHGPGERRTTQVSDQVGYVERRVNAGSFRHPHTPRHRPGGR